jgi:acyl-CoA thioester hydrolase
MAIFPKGGNEALITGEIVWVYTNQKTHRPVPIPASMRGLIGSRERHLSM